MGDSCRTYKWTVNRLRSQNRVFSGLGCIMLIKKYKKTLETGFVEFQKLD